MRGVRGGSIPQSRFIRQAEGLRLRYLRFSSACVLTKAVSRRLVVMYISSIRSNSQSHSRHKSVSHRCIQTRFTTLSLLFSQSLSKPCPESRTGSTTVLVLVLFQSHAGNKLPTSLSDGVPQRGNAEQLKIPVGLVLFILVVKVR